MQTPAAFRYILRYKIDPMFHAQDRMAELLDFCSQSHVEEVMLFLPAEELNPGHLTYDELQPYIDMAHIFKPQLAQRDIDLSLNPWSSTLGITRGRTLRAGQNFSCIVGENGTTNKTNACPLCPEWQDYICDIYAYMARSLQPVAIWIEDDWRLHNHDLALGWGGCFCQLHLDRMAQKVGRAVTRQEVLERILAPGKPHPWRKLWLEVSRESLLEPAAKIRNAVQAACSTTRLGLMSSSPDIHSAEGRDWHALQEAFGDQPAFLTRPHIMSYTETTAIQAPPSITRLTLANLKRPLDIYPELEASPRSGPYSKCATFGQWICRNSAVYGAQGITINQFDMMGNGTALHPEFGDALAAVKGQLNALVELGIDDNNSQGVNVLFSPQVSTYLHSTMPSSMKGLCQDSTLWSKTFFTLGIAHRFSDSIIDPIAPYAVNGQTLRAFDDRDIETLLSRTVLLDAYSAEILLQRGFGDMIGLSDAQWQAHEDSAFSYESIIEPDPSVYGLAHPRVSAQRCADKMLAMTLDPNARIRSVIRRYDHQDMFPGLYTFNNDIGGRIAVLAYPLDGQKQFFMGFFNHFRRMFLQKLLFELTPQAPLAAAENHPFNLYRTMAQKGLLLAAFNIILDPVDHLVLRLPAGEIDPLQLKILDAQGRWQPASAQLSPGGHSDQLRIDTSLSALDGAFLWQPS